MESPVKNKKQILFALSECVPFIKSGGLADVGGALPLALNRKRNLEVSVIMPQYSAIPHTLLKKLEPVCSFELYIGWRKKYCGINKLKYRGVTFYFVDNRDYFFNDYLYGYGAYEAERFAFFNIAVLEALPHIGLSPDVIHCHDWQTAMIPALLNIRYAYSSPWDNIKTVFTIHNLRYQGVFDANLAPDFFGLDRHFVDSGLIGHNNALNFLKGALTYSDKITTVSPTYAKEIMTSWGGEGLEYKIAERHLDVTGILNGIDEKLNNPADDIDIPFSFSADDLSGKLKCKKELGTEAGLPHKKNIPLIGMVGRLTSQKGLDLIEHVLDDILQEDLQLVILGTGDVKYGEMFEKYSKKYPDKLSAFITFDSALAKRIYAGSDMFLMPSLFEPCGLAQMISLKYGTLPIVRETGGLKDTVFSYDDITGSGNGFTFTAYNAHDMLFTIKRAVTIFKKKKDVWKNMQVAGMTTDFSWKASAKHYMDMYLNIL